MIQAKFGLPGIALRTLEVYTTATLEATLATPAPRRARLARGDGAAVVERARGVPRHVYEDPRFLEYFRAATPEAELDAMHIGSRPARREPAGCAAVAARDSVAVRVDADAAAARPRGSAIEEAIGVTTTIATICREMYRDWPFFRSTIELMEMALAKADAGIAAHYDRHLVPPDQQDLGAHAARAPAARHRASCSTSPATAAARRQPRAPPLDRRAQPVRRSDQPAAGRAAAPPRASRPRRRTPRRPSGCAARCS